MCFFCIGVSWFPSFGCRKLLYGSLFLVDYKSCGWYIFCLVVAFFEVSSAPAHLRDHGFILAHPMQK